MAKIRDNLSKLGIILYDAAAGHEGEGDCDFPVAGVGPDVDIAIRSLVVSKSKASEFYPLVLPLSVNDMLLVQQPTRDIDHSYLQISLNLANGGVHPIHAFAVQHAPEGFGLFVYLRDVVLVVEGKLL